MQTQSSLVQVRCVEFQKRGLPHAHILLILHPDDALRDVDDWDTAVSAELPDERQFPEVCLIPALSNAYFMCAHAACSSRRYFCVCAVSFTLISVPVCTFHTDFSHRLMRQSQGA